MSITVVGSIAFDSVTTPHGSRVRMLGGAATHFSLAASHLDHVRVVGTVGDDFGEEELDVLRTRGTDVSDVERVPGGRTFSWAGTYAEDLDERTTLDTQLNVFEHFAPRLSDASRRSDVLFLANIQPALQSDVLDQCGDPGFVALDSMDLWIDVAREALLEVIGRVDCLLLNDAELRQLTGVRDPIQAAHAALDLGPEAVVLKRGEHGAALVTREGCFVLPAFAGVVAVDPTGAGDTFAGGFVGALSRSAGGARTPAVLRRAMAYGTTLASFNVEGFGTDRLQALEPAELDARLDELWTMTSFDRVLEPLGS